VDAIGAAQGAHPFPLPLQAQVERLSAQQSPARGPIPSGEGGGGLARGSAFRWTRLLRIENDPTLAQLDHDRMEVPVFQLLHRVSSRDGYSRARSGPSC
jgi:hypothetical protein